MKKTGRVLMTAELGEEYGFVDINGEKFFLKKILRPLQGCFHGLKKSATFQATM